MGVYVDKIKGFTVELPELNIETDDFLYNNKNEYYYNGRECKPNKVYLINDGMNGDYTRIVYIEKQESDVNFDDNEDYFSLKQKELTYEIYNQLNKLYKLLIRKELDKKDIDYALWFHYR